MLCAKHADKSTRMWVYITGYHINEKFGFGALDAAQMVQVAQTWSNVGPQHNCVVQAMLNSNM